MSKATAAALAVVFVASIGVNLVLIQTQTPDHSDAIAARDADHADLVERVDSLDSKLDTLTGSIETLSARLDRSADRFDDLESLAARLSDSAAGTASPDAAGLADAGFRAGDAASEDEVAEFKDLMEKFFADGASLSTDDQERFYKLARSKVLEGLMDDLEEEIESHPTDLDARMELADLYIAKLFTVPGGPEQGLWGQRAEKQWKEVATQDPNHWEAHFNIGSSLYYYPEFLNRTNDAIDWMEKSRALLANRPASDEDAPNYVQLAQLYQRQDKNGKAREVLEAGLDRLPRNTAIQDALSSLETKGDE